MQENRPTIRLIHHLARTGGTIICRCLEAMQNVYLLSEIHPLGTATFNPLEQAQKNYQLFNAEDMSRITGGVTFSFADAIALISDRVTEKGGELVVRDWSHLDFTGVPWVEKPAYQLLLQRALEDHFNILSIATVRHPIDQWLSLRELRVIRGKLSLQEFMYGYRRFAEIAQPTGFLRYEDFTRSPNTSLESICTTLKLVFDPDYTSRWSSGARLTGDGGARGKSTTIKLPVRKPMEAGLLEQFESNEDYRRSLELLGYSHPA